MDNRWKDEKCKEYRHDIQVTHSGSTQVHGCFAVVDLVSLHVCTPFLSLGAVKPLKSKPDGFQRPTLISKAASGACQNPGTDTGRACQQPDTNTGRVCQQPATNTGRTWTPLRLSHIGTSVTNSCRAYGIEILSRSAVHQFWLAFSQIGLLRVYMYLLTIE